jgi:hypothetical protein
MPPEMSDSGIHSTDGRSQIATFVGRLGISHQLSVQAGGTRRTVLGERLEVSPYADAIHTNRECTRVAEDLRGFASTGVKPPQDAMLLPTSSRYYSE